jgi:hypothetical protein
MLFVGDELIEIGKLSLRKKKIGIPKLSCSFTSVIEEVYL